MWLPLFGEQIYPDNLDDVWFGNFIPGVLEFVEGDSQTIYDMDDCVDGENQLDADKNRFHVIGSVGWGHVDVDYVQDVDDTSANGVRLDCAGPEYNVTGAIEQELGSTRLFTCVTSGNRRYSLAGDTHGTVWVQDHTLMTEVAYNAGVALNPVIRIFMGYRNLPGERDFYAFRSDATVVYILLNISTGVVITNYVIDLKVAAQNDGDTFDEAETVTDVCVDHSSQRFMVKTLNDLYFVRRTSFTNPVPPPYFTSVIAVNNWDSYGSVEMIGMEFISNDYVLALGATPGLCTWYKTPKPDTAVAGVATAKVVKIEGNHRWLHILPYADGSSALLVGQIYNDKDSSTTFDGKTGDMTIGIYSATMTPDEDITPKLLFSFNGNPGDSSWWDQYIYSCPSTARGRASCQMYRGRRRFGTNQFWLVAVGRDYMLTLGDRLTTPSFSSNGLTSTSNLLTWRPPVHEEASSMAYYLIERSECDGDYSCVYANDDLDVCRYVDIQHPSILPQERGNTGIYKEVGLVHQTEIDDIDPRKDDFPEGRAFYYKFRYVSFLNIETNSAVNPATTKLPIKPVEVDDSVDLNHEYTNIIPTARGFILHWDWTPLGETSDDFLMWQIAFFEDQNLSLYDGTWSAFQHYPQPRAYPGTAPTNVWRYILPWRSDEDHSLICWVDGVNFKNSEKSRLVDKKYLRWDDGDPTVEGDKRYSRLLPDTEYVCSIIGWDTGGLWRASAKMTHVPPSFDTYDNEEMTIDRQIIYVRTEPETNFVSICEFENNGELFKFWDDRLSPPSTTKLNVEGTLAAPVRVGEEFYVQYEVTLNAISFYVDEKVGNPGDLRVSIFEFDDVANTLPGIEIPSSVSTILAPSIVTGWNKVSVGPLSLKYGRYLVAVGPGSNFLPGHRWRIKTGQWTGDNDHFGWRYSGGWGPESDKDSYFYLWFSDSSFAEGFVIEGGNELTFSFNKSTNTFNQDEIFEDQCYTDEDLYDIILGNNLLYTSGSILHTSPDTIFFANPNENYGIESRAMLLKLKMRINNGWPAEKFFGVHLHETHPEDIILDGIGVPSFGRGYSVLFQFNSGNIVILQRKRFDANVIWWDDSIATTLPGYVPTVGEDFDLWIKIIDDTISVFCEMNGNTTEENYSFGNSVAKATIWNDGLDYYDFCRYGLFGFSIPDITPTGSLSILEIKTYGKYVTNELSGGQGIYMDWGDDSSSGFVADTELEKLYSIDPDDNIEEYDAWVSGKNQDDNIDLGFVPPWIDYPGLIAEEDYDKQIFEMYVTNAPPIAVLNVQSTGYTGVIIGIDGIGSEDAEGGNLIYHWNFGDGNSTTTTTPYVNHIYPVLGSYTITLYVTDELGQSSDVESTIIDIVELYSNYVTLDFNHPISAEQVDRDSGVSSDNIPDRCGGEIQDSGPGNRRFNIRGLHAPPRCCCDEETEYKIALNLQRLCRIVTVTEEGIIPGEGEGEGGGGEEGGPIAVCEHVEYENIIPFTSLRIVGDSNGASTMYQQSETFFFVDPMIQYDLCAVDIYVASTTLSGLPWSVKVSIQADGGGIPSGIVLASSTMLVTALTVPGFNKFEMDVITSWWGGVTLWIVIEPVPCPILSGLPDYIEIGSVAPPPGFFANLECTPQCIPGCIWAPTIEELNFRVYTQTIEMGPDIPGSGSTIGEDSSIFTQVSERQYGCCTIQGFGANHGVAQSMGISSLSNMDETTKLKFVIPMCKSLDFDGDVEVKLLMDLISNKQIGDTVTILNSDIGVCPVSYAEIDFNSGTENMFYQEDDEHTDFDTSLHLSDYTPGPDFGDGSDGDVVINGNIVLIADMNYENLTVEEGAILDTAGYIIRIRRRLSNDGIITDLQTGGAGGAGGAGGTAPPAEGHDDGDDGVAGIAGTLPESGTGGQGGGGGGSGATQGYAGDGGHTALGGNGGNGGAGGLGGGYVRIFAFELNNNGSINANGEDGESGNVGSDGNVETWLGTKDMAGGGGGGGAGGAGGEAGTVELTYNTLISMGIVESLGGNGGIGGAKGLKVNTVYALPGGAIASGGGKGYGAFGWGDGGDGGDGTEGIGGSIDGISGEMGLSQSSNTPSISTQYGLYPTTQGYYVRTSNLNQIDTSSWTKILGINIDQTTPSGTSIRYLISTDGRITWNRWNGNNWVASLLANIGTEGNTKTELDDITESQWAILFTQGTLDIAVYLRTTNNTNTPLLRSVEFEFEHSGAGTQEVEVEFDVCNDILNQLSNIYVTIMPRKNISGTINIISTTPYSDRYHYGSKYEYSNGSWIQKQYEDICMIVYSKSECYKLGWCEYEFIDWLRCARSLVKLDLPGFGIIGGKIVDHSVSKSPNEPFAWIPFSISFEEIDPEQCF